MTSSTELSKWVSYDNPLLNIVARVMLFDLIIISAYIGLSRLGFNLDILWIFIWILVFNCEYIVIYAGFSYLIRR